VFVNDADIFMGGPVGAPVKEQRVMMQSVMGMGRQQTNKICWKMTNAALAIPPILTSVPDELHEIQTKTLSSSSTFETRFPYMRTKL
jgi:hypothetical protein